MRVNVYNEEITNRIELVEKTVEDTGEKFYGVRFYLASPQSSTARTKVTTMLRA
jgi:hypothetical protein